MGLLKSRLTKSLGFVNSELILTAYGYLTSILTLKPGHIVVEAMASPKEDGFPKKRGRRLSPRRRLLTGDRQSRKKRRAWYWATAQRVKERGKAALWGAEEWHFEICISNSDISSYCLWNVSQVPQTQCVWNLNSYQWSLQILFFSTSPWMVIHSAMKKLESKWGPSSLPSTSHWGRQTHLSNPSPLLQPHSLVWLDFLQYPLPRFPDFNGDSQFFSFRFFSPLSMTYFEHGSRLCMVSTQIHPPTLFLCQQSPDSVQVFSVPPPVPPFPPHTPSVCSGNGILSPAPGKRILVSKLKLWIPIPLSVIRLGKSPWSERRWGRNPFRMLYTVPGFSSWGEGSRLKRISEMAEGMERTGVSEDRVEQVGYSTWIYPTSRLLVTGEK